MNRPDFSVLLSIYRGTLAGEFREALQSVSTQTEVPRQLVAILDGPVADDVRDVLQDFASRTGIEVTQLDFTENRGLGPALADGVLACRYELVARVDTDDINLDDRFAAQLAHFSKHPDLDVLGGWLEELTTHPDGSQTRRIRKVPGSEEDIRSGARFRNPLNHPTVMFRRQSVLDAGNYQPMLWFEDYELWARMLLSGCRIQNLSRVLVRAHADSDYFERRGGLRYLKQEFKLAGKLRQIGYHNFLDTLRFLGVRTLFRLIPNGFRRWGYAKVLRAERI